MESTLRSGLSLGLSGFSFWSHDMGGFVKKAPEDLYKRWTAFGMLVSHSRTHGAPPTEPWEYGEAFLGEFREMDEMRYKLMPYIYAQAKDCSEKGLPMTRALFVEYPRDPGAWLVDNQYLFGSDILVAPLFDENRIRSVYLPTGNWIDYQTGKTYPSGWHQIEADNMPVVMLVKDGAVIPHIKLAQSTMQMDWSELELVVYASQGKKAQGLVCLPSDNKLEQVEVTVEGNNLKLTENPLVGDVKFRMIPFKSRK